MPEFNGPANLQQASKLDCRHFRYKRLVFDTAPFVLDRAAKIANLEMEDLKKGEEGLVLDSVESNGCEPASRM